MFFSTSKLVTEYVNRGSGYDDIRNRINIVYFNLGYGTDFVYYGKTESSSLRMSVLIDLKARDGKIIDNCHG